VMSSHLPMARKPRHLVLIGVELNDALERIAVVHDLFFDEIGRRRSLVPRHHYAAFGRGSAAVRLLDSIKLVRCPPWEPKVRCESSRVFKVTHNRVPAQQGDLRLAVDHALEHLQLQRGDRDDVQQDQLGCEVRLDPSPA
jgi:hypothetical protein